MKVYLSRRAAISYTTTKKVRHPKLKDPAFVLVAPNQPLARTSRPRRVC